jgi:adenosylcobinamide-GDP ribazoletransferase
MPPFVRGVRACVFFLTRVPVGGYPYSDDDWRWSTAYFPLIGAALGLAYAGVWKVFIPAGALVAATLVVGAGLLFTGCFHEDGLADTADALGGGMNKQHILEILKDSRIGAFGAAALCSVLLLRVALLAQLGAATPWALIVSQSVARLPPIALMVALPYVTNDEAAKSKQVTRARWEQLVVASVISALVAASMVWSGLSYFGMLRGLCFTAFSAAVLGLRFRAKVGGITGDFLGATEQVSECCLLLGFAFS